MKRMLISICVTLAMFNVRLGAEPEAPAFVHELTKSYTTKTMHGFTVRVSAAATAHPETTDPALELLDEELAEVIELTPKHTHEALRSVVFWVEHNAPEHPCACYHPSAIWLLQNGFNPEKARGIEIANPKNFVEWTGRDQPLMVLHELAHAFHHAVLGYDNALIASCFEKAQASGKYDEVMHVSGKARRHYALSNDREYFAELSESYFGRNDFAPFTREELRVFDPAGFAMIEKLWFEIGEEE